MTAGSRERDRFVEKAHRQSALLAESPTADEDQEFVDELTDGLEEVFAS